MTDQQVRNRKSYKMFEKIAEAFDISIDKGLLTTYEIMDNNRNFGSRTHALYAKESLTLLLKERTFNIK